HFADEASTRHGLPLNVLQPAQRAQLLHHPWPGNVRELQNVAERFALGLELALDEDPNDAAQSSHVAVSGSLSEQVEQYEKSLIGAELERSHSSMRSLAEALGVPRKTLHDKLRKHGLHFESGSQPHTDELD
ncbi:helix-turn-helix domain-containing protein, partial [Pseudomonas endophytica]|uniref:helix-turn-helix domain-containing protein n=1 Tax=Pseudomonas endophytica TaxID=1563157 RepID=UPI000B0B1407